MHTRRDMDKKDRDLILQDFLKHDHPLEDQRPYLFSPINGRTPPQVNVHNSRQIGDKRVNECLNILTVLTTEESKCLYYAITLALFTPT